MAVGLALLELVVLLEPVEHALVRLLLREPGELAGALVHAPVGTDDGVLREAVSEADLVVQGVMSRSDLERAGAEVALDTLVGDHRHASLDERDDHVAADEVAIAIVLWVHRDRDVREDRCWPHRRDRDVPLGLGERVAHVAQRVVDVLVRDLEVGEGRLVERAPVDDPVRPVDPALPVEMDEVAHDRAHVRVVHREALAAVVERGAGPAELEHDLAAVLAQPLPDARLERLPAEVLPRLPLGREMFLDGVLGRDPRVVEAGLEERVVALHAARADDRVGEGQLQRMA